MDLGRGKSRRNWMGKCSLKMYAK